MARRQSLSTNARRAIVSNLVRQGLVGSQSDLVELLADEGIEVTQATASRDLDEIGAVRGKEGGELRYRIIEGSESAPRVSKVSNDLILSITVSANLVVVKTPAGGAQLLASTLDRAAQSGELPAIVGTIAGDDTVLVIAKSVNAGRTLSHQLQEFIENRSSLAMKRKAAH